MARRGAGPRAWRGLAIGGLLFGLLPILAGGVFYTLRAGWIAEATQVDGIVVALAPSSRGSSPTVEFLVDGAPVRVTAVWSTNPPAYDVGESIQVTYDPADPTDALIGGAFARWWPVYVMAGTGLIFWVLASIAWIVSLRVRQ